MGEWREYKLGELVDITNGFAFKSEKFLSIKTDDSLPVIKIKNVANGDVHLNDCLFHKYDDSLKKYLIRKNNILIALTGNHPEVMTQVVGEASRYKLEDEALLNQRVAKIEAKSNLDNDFLYYFLKDDTTHDQLASQSAGSANQANISKANIEELIVKCPLLYEQKVIASILSSLDDKIDLLHRQNKTLEQLAEALFRQWFVEEADESWSTKRISDVTEINFENISKEYRFSEIYYLDTGSITEGIISDFKIFQVTDAPSRAQRIVREEDIVYSLVRPIQRHYGILHNIKPNTIASTGFCVITCTKMNPYFIYLLLSQEDVVEYLDSVAEGSTSAYPSLKPSDIANFKFLMPDNIRLEKFNSLSLETWGKIKLNQKQIRTLTQLRDILLPKLMSGDVRVKI